MSKHSSKAFRHKRTGPEDKPPRKREKRLSLLDLEPEQGPTQRERLIWQAFHQNPFAESVQRFLEAYGEEPILWRRLSAQDVDVFFTHPENVLLISLATGELVRDDRLERSVWTRDLKKYSLERRRHISNQAASLLDGLIRREDWKPEVMHSFRFREERRDELLGFLVDLGLPYCLEKEGFKRTIRVFAAPDMQKTFYKRGVERGLLEDVTSG